MKSHIIYFSIIAIGLISCGGDNHSAGDGHDHGHEDGHGEEEHEGKVHLSQEQVESLDLKSDTLQLRNIGSFVEANGELEVPPQNEARVTAIIGANISQIRVIEGDKVEKGEVLAYVSHPDLITLQTDYTTSKNELDFLESEYSREEKLYKQGATSGKKFEKAKSEYLVKKSQVEGYKAKLGLLGIGTKSLMNGEIQSRIPVRSPIDGHIRNVEVQMGQYVQPETDMFEIVNVDHIHADLMVFEKDMHKVNEGQKVVFNVESLPDKDLEATIYSVGKAFEKDPKAIHIHADITKKEGLLIPGMYVRGKIMTDSVQGYALPHQGVVREGDQYFVFIVKEEVHEGEKQWEFEPIEVIIGEKNSAWMEIKFLNPPPKGSQFAWNSAFYLMAEMKKGEAEHSH